MPRVTLRGLHAGVAAGRHLGGRRRQVGGSSQGKGVAAMPTTTHTRSVHIDAPVETVFEYVKDPENFFAVMYRAHPRLSGQITRRSTEVEEGSTYEWSGRHPLRTCLCVRLM
jgi:uncharacterized membrane protein